MTDEPGQTRGGGLRLAAYTGLILFFELALIRFTAGYVRVFGFYLNFVLIATFLGMGVGLLRAEQSKTLRWIAVPTMLLLFVTTALFAVSPIDVALDQNELLWGIVSAFEGHRIPLQAVVASLFALCAVFFIPLGSLVGAEFRQLPPLKAYTWDIAGSLAGILAFGLLSATRQPPMIWFGLGFAVWTVVSLGDRRFAAALTAASVISVSIVAWMGHAEEREFWSPYYRIDLKAFPGTFQVSVNGSLHQYVLNLDSVASKKFAYSDTARTGYLRPYNLLARVDTVLVVGAGTGNDLALALQRGAKYIDAVEIDPVIADLGGALHFQQPYADPRVHLHVNDARAFLRTTSRHYDLIVFGTLDSQTLLSGMSSVRLDNYVYTRESFRAARERLAPGGTLIVYHMSGQTYIAGKIYQMIGSAFGQEPGVFTQWSKLFNYVFVAGGAAARVPAADPAIMAQLREPVELPRDDWPYLYVRGRTIPAHYLVALATILLMTLGLATIGAGDVLRRGVDWPMFFLGAGFLLVETKSVTEMSLLFGSTWTVNLFVFSSILIMVLAANLVVIGRPFSKTTPLFGALLGTLAVAWAVPTSSLLGLGVAGQWIVGGLLVAVPIFFAALIFSTLLGRSADGARSLAYNLLGAIVGGVLEYSSMAIGIKGLYIVAALLYLAAALSARRADRRVVPA